MEEKLTTSLERSDGTHPQRVLIVGDSKEDAAPIQALQAEGVDVDFLYVMKGNDQRKLHPAATIGVTKRDFAPLYSLLTK